jgi:hypothetical protein
MAGRATVFGDPVAMAAMLMLLRMPDDHDLEHDR